MQPSWRADDLDKEAASKRGWKVLLTIGVVLVVAVVATAAVRSNAKGMHAERSYALESKPDAFEDSNHVMSGFPNSDVMAVPDATVGMVNGIGTEWVAAPSGQNCQKVCSDQHMTAVKRGSWVSGNKNPFYVCAAKSSVAAHAGLRTGFNLPGWNNGQCCIAYGSWQNRPQMQCLCKHSDSKSKWVTNGGKYSSCTRVCGKEKLLAVSSGSFLAVAKNPRYDVCSADSPYDGRIGWNLGLIPFGQWCTSGWGGSYTKGTRYHCYCDEPVVWCEPAKKN